MRRLIITTVTLVLLAGAALAQTPGEVAGEVEFRGYYAGPGADVDIDRMERLADDYPAVGFVALSRTPTGGADLFADEVLAGLSGKDTVIVLTEDEVGLTSAVYGDDVLERALDRAGATTGSSYEVDFAEIAGALEPVSATTTAGSPTTTVTATGAGETSGSGGGIGGWVFLGVVVVAGFVLWRGMRRRKAGASRRLDTARAEIRAQMDVVANEILRLGDRADVEAKPEALAHYRTASEVFREAEERLAAAAGDADLERLSDDLDRARWELAAAEALVEGKPVPPRPETDKPEPCFFDPNHGAGAEEAELRTPAGPRKVWVCTADAEKLRRGDRPEPRSIDVGGRRLPAPQAPRTHGGRGFDWLDAFSILVGGMSSATGYRLGKPRGRRLSGGSGGLGLPFPGLQGRRRAADRVQEPSRGPAPSPESPPPRSRTVGRARGRRR
jgi:hypothetical protein